MTARMRDSGEGFRELAADLAAGREAVRGRPTRFFRAAKTYAAAPLRNDCTASSSVS